MATTKRTAKKAPVKSVAKATSTARKKSAAPAANAKSVRTNTAKKADVQHTLRTPEKVIEEVINSHAKKHFTKSDHQLLRQYGELSVMLDRLLAEAANSPGTILGANGVPQAHPIFTSIGRVEKAALDAAAKLRITPSSRTRASRQALPSPDTMPGINERGPRGRTPGMFGNPSSPRAHLMYGAGRRTAPNGTTAADQDQDNEDFDE